MTIGQLYNLDSFKKFKDSGEKQGFKDSFGGVVLSRNLTAVNPKIFEKKYPELSFINSGITADNSGGFANFVQTLRLSEQGGFTDSSDTGEKGKISLTAEDSIIKVFQKEAHSKWSEDEIKQAEMQNINLVQNYLATHNKLYSQLVDEIGYVGHNGQDGLLNYAGFTASTALGAIATLTPDQMYNEIAALITDQRNGVNNTPEYSCNKVVMPVSVMNTLQVTVYNSANGSSSVLKALKDNFADVDFVTTFRASNIGGSSRVVAYSNKEDSMVMRIPQPLTIGEIVKETSFDYRVDSRFRIAGLDVLENSSGRTLIGL